LLPRVRRRALPTWQRQPRSVGPSARLLFDRALAVAPWFCGRRLRSIDVGLRSRHSWGTRMRPKIQWGQFGMCGRRITGGQRGHHDRDKHESPRHLADDTAKRGTDVAKERGLPASGPVPGRTLRAESSRTLLACMRLARNHTRTTSVLMNSCNGADVRQASWTDRAPINLDRRRFWHRSHGAEPLLIARVREALELGPEADVRLEMASGK